MTSEVKNDSIVKVHYIGSLPDSDQVFDTSRKQVAKENEIFNESREYEPLSVEIGKKQVITGFENALLGMKVGDRKVVDIPSNEAYGPIRDDLKIEVSDDEFKKSKINPEIGMIIQTSNGNAMITNYNENENKVTLDFNHPLAGKDLKFDLEVMSIN